MITKIAIEKIFGGTLGVLFCVLPLLTSCSDDDVQPSAVDEKLWDLDKNMDESYRPGDNFYMYCNGAYWNAIDCDGWIIDFFVDEVGDMMQQRIDQVDDPRLNKIKADFANYGSNYEASDVAIRRLMEVVNQANTPEALWRALAQIIREGGCTILNLLTIPDGGNLYLYFNACGDWHDIEVLVQNWTGVSTLLRRAGMSEEEAARTVSLASDFLSDSEVQQILEQMQQEFTPQMFLRHPELKEHFSLPSASRAAVPGEAIQQVMAEELGIVRKIMNYDSSLQLLAHVEGLDVPTLKALLHSLLALDYLYASPEALDEFNRTWEGVTIDELRNSIQYTYFGYITSYVFATHYVTPELKQQYLTICEEMRQTFRKRIEALDWMSATTKTAALEKLEAMRFDAGYPDAWIEEGLPSLDGASLVEDVMQLRKAYTALRINLGGQNAQDANFNDCIATPGYDLTQTNAFYTPTTNSLCIFPCFLLEPLYSPAYSDAFNYAVFMVIGHEMTHGFDSDGANYDKIGDVRNWWTVADKMEFEDRQQLLVNCYDQLELLPDEMPGVYAPGEQTLTENIADLGGFLIAYQAYMERLDRDGFTGEERLKQERKFFQGYAGIWRAKYGSEYVDYMLFQAKDVHSMGKERINGVVMNCDRWYELYDVREGDKLYLPVERRTYLW